MAFGDIHNHNGSVCKAQKRPCPLGAEGHSKSIEDFVEHHVEESALDADAVRSMIADGTPPADAIDVAKAGGGWLAQSMSFVDLTDDQMDIEDEMDAQVNEEVYGYIRDLKGNERREEIAKIEKIMASEYETSAYENVLEHDYEETGVPENPSPLYKATAERINNAFKGSLAVIHNVPKDKVTTNEDGTINVERGDGYTSIYNKDFKLNKVQKNVSEKQRIEDRENDEETYSYIRELKGDERKREVANVEYIMAGEYQESISEAKYTHDYGDHDEVPENPTNEYKADVEYIRESYRNSLAMIHDVPYDKVTENAKGEIEIAREGGMVSVYKSDFTFKDVEDR